jgi:predicted component of type VI protein secretion system
LVWQGFRRTPSETERSLEQISPRELGNAMVALCGSAAGMTEDQLWVGTLEVFGFTRRSASQVSRLESALALVLASGRVTRRADGVLVTEPAATR